MLKRQKQIGFNAMNSVVEATQSSNEKSGHTEEISINDQKS